MALTGALVRDQCLPSQAEALDAFYSATVPAYTAGTTSYMGEFVKVAGVWKIQRYSISSTGTVTTLTASNAPVITFPACDPTINFMDGVAIGWGIAAAIVVAFTFKLMQRAAG